MIFRPGCPFVQRSKVKVFSRSRWFIPMDVSLLPFFTHQEESVRRAFCSHSFHFMTLFLITQYCIFVVVRLNSNVSKANSVIWTSPRLVSEPKKAHFII